MVFLILTRILPSISPLCRCANQGTNRLNDVLKVTLIDHESVFYTILPISTCSSKNIEKGKSSSDYSKYLSPSFLFQYFLKVHFVYSCTIYWILQNDQHSKAAFFSHQWMCHLNSVKVKVLNDGSICRTFISLKRLCLEHLRLFAHTLSHEQFRTDTSRMSNQEPYVWFLLCAIGISLFYQLQLRWLGTTHLPWLILQLLLLNIMFFWSGVGFWAITHQRLIYQYSNNCEILQWEIYIRNFWIVSWMKIFLFGTI